MNSKTIVKIQINELKYQDKDFKDGFISTIYKKEKINLLIPFKKPLYYEFNTNEEEMKFKYVITKNDTLIGFVQIDIPLNQRYNKKFIINDYFPVILPNSDKNNYLNSFKIKIKLSYESDKSLNANNILHEIKDNISPSKNLKNKIKDLKRSAEKIPNGFHLDQFEKNLMNQKLSENTNNNNKKINKDFTDDKKKNFYKNISNSGYKDSIKKIQINNKYEKNYDDNSQVDQEIVNAKKELTNLKIKLRNYESGKIEVDNYELSKKLLKKMKNMEKEMNDIKNKNDYLEKYQEEQLGKFDWIKTQLKEDFTLNQANLNDVMEENKLLKLSITNKEQVLNQKSTKVNENKHKIDYMKTEVLKKLENFKKEKEEFNKKTIEFYEYKNRLIKERQKIIEDITYNMSEKTKLKNEDKIINEKLKELENEKNDYLIKENKINQDFEIEKLNLNKKVKNFEEEKSKFYQYKENCDKEFKNIGIKKKQLDDQEIRLWRDKNKFHKELDEYVISRNIFEEEKKIEEEEIENTVNDLEKERDELFDQFETLEEIKLSLEEIENQVFERDTIYQNEKNKFETLRTAFFEHLNSGNFSKEDLQEFKVNFSKEVNNIRRDTKIIKGNNLDKQKERIRQKTRMLLDEMKQCDDKNIRSKTMKTVSKLKNKSIALDNTKFEVKLEVDEYINNLFKSTSNDYLDYCNRMNNKEIEKLRKLINIFELLLEEIKIKNKNLNNQNNIIVKKEKKIEIKHKNPFIEKYLKQRYESDDIKKICSKIKKNEDIYKIFQIVENLENISDFIKDKYKIENEAYYELKSDSIDILIDDFNKLIEIILSENPLVFDIIIKESKEDSELNNLQKQYITEQDFEEDFRLKNLCLEKFITEKNLEKNKMEGVIDKIKYNLDFFDLFKDDTIIKDKENKFKNKIKSKNN